MKPQPRWIKSILVESAKPGILLPWQRGTRQFAADSRSVQPEAGASARH